MACTFFGFSFLINTIIITVSHAQQHSWVYRKNWVLERNETWGVDGHIYLIREEQPFFRVYHPHHMKVAPPAPPPPADSAKQGGGHTATTDARPREQLSPLEFQMREEKGSDQRMRAAAEFWRERNRRLHGERGRTKRALHEEDGEQRLQADSEGEQRSRQQQRMFTPEQVRHMTKEEMPDQLVDKEFRTNIGGGGGEQKSTLEAPRMEVWSRNRSRAEAKFGHHHLPQGEVKDSARWPWQIWPYMHCTSHECACPLFRGTVIGHQCILPNGKPLKKAVRKEFRTYTPEEMTLFLEAMRRFKASGLYTRLGMIHRRSGVHSGPSFFPWHREFLKRLEILFRAMHPENTEPVLGLPYWDSTLDHGLPAPEDSVMFSEFLLGEPDEAGFVTNGLFANWTTMDGRHSFQRMFGDQPDGEFVNEARIDWVLSQTSVERVMAFSLALHTCLNYEPDDRFLEYSHDYTHYFISGDMQERFSSSNDPIFFMHHGFIDSIWEMWRQKKQPISKKEGEVIRPPYHPQEITTRLQRETDYPRAPGDPNCAPEWHFPGAYMPLLQPLRNIDVLSNNYTDNMYEYAPRPSCAQTGRTEDCGNPEFLWCDTKSHLGNAVCTAKIKPGGNCAGFEWSAEVCYGGGQCLEGKCTRKGMRQVDLQQEGDQEMQIIGDQNWASAKMRDQQRRDWHPISYMK